MGINYNLKTKKHECVIEHVQIGQKIGQKVEMVFEQIKSNPMITRDELCLVLHMAPSSIQRYINILKVNRIRREGGDKGGKWVIIEQRPLV